MVTIFDRRRLLVEISAQEAARVTELLKIHNIEYYEKTFRSQSMVSMMINANMTKQKGYGRANSLHYVYHIYVRRRDYDTARRLMKE